MKSLLVDALRQAQGQLSEDDTGEVAADSGELSIQETGASGSEDDSRRDNVPELDLLKTGAIKVGESAGIPGTDVLPESEPESEPEPDTVLSQDDEPEIELVQDPDAPLLNATMILDTRGATLAEKTPVIAKIGRLTPILCLIGMATAATVYLLIARLAVLGLNEDLSDISERVRMDLAGVDASDEWQNLPVSEINVFDQFVISNQVLPEPADIKRPVETAGIPLDKTAARPQQSRQADNSNAAVVIERSYSAGGGINDRAYGFVVNAYESYRARNYEQAERQYNEALAIEPNHSDALAGLAAVYRQTGREPQALRRYEQLLSLDPGNTMAASAILSISSADAGWDNESELKHLLQRFPDAHHLHFALASVYVGQSRWPDARHEFLAAHQLNPANADYSYNLAVSMEKLGDYAAARDYYETALATADDASNIDTDAISAHLDELAAELREPS
jgi:Flp pilus assembly protein TadD